MNLRTFGTGLMIATLGILAGCRGSDSSSTTGAGTVSITVLGQYEKRTLSTSGFGATTTPPARYAYAQVVNSSTNRVEAEGTLGSDGTGTFSVPRGITFFVALYATVEVPNSPADTGFYFYGGVKKAIPASTYASTAAFNQITTWSTTSADTVANSSGNLTLRALESTGEAGAFAIADQMTTFALGLRQLEPGLRPPELYAFWNPGTFSTYPSAAFATGGTTVLTQSTALGGRVVFQQEVRYAAPTAADGGADAYNDSLLLETFSRLLFADDSLAYGNGTYGTIIRRDNDNVWVDRTVQSESTVAFVAGFADFLAGAVRNDSRLLDTYVDATGVARVNTFDLTDHTYVPSASKGEFTRGSIAVSLWGLWKNVLGGNQAGLNTLWAAVRSTRPYLDGTGEYEQATLGCYPSYLLGVQSRVSAPTWTAALTELALETVANPNTAYFAGTALWATVAIPLSTTGSLQTYVSTANLYYDRNQSQAYRFTHNGTGPRTITMTPTGGQDFYLELFGPGGQVTGSYGTPGSARTLSLTSLPAGVYVARVRAGATTATGTFGYTISVN